MRGFAVLLRKEAAAVFSSPIAYVIVTVFLALMGYTFTLNLFVAKAATLVPLFFQMYVLLILTVPVITMRLVAEERKLRTMEVLLTAPVTESQVVIAKYAASMSLVAVMILLSGSYAVVLGIFGSPDWGPTVSGYAGLLLLGSALVSVGLLMSSLTSNQLVAALLALGLFMLLWIIDDFGYLLPAPLDGLFVNMSLSVHFVPFATGSVYLSDIGYFLCLTLLGLFLSMHALARR